MKSNLLRFPQELTTRNAENIASQTIRSKCVDSACELIPQMNEMDLMRLREAFDKARLDWPEEEAELPEKNKIHSF